MTHYVAMACCCIALQLASSDAFAAHLEPILSGLSSPVLVTHAGDGSGRLFVVEQAGVIKVLAPLSGTPTVFLDIHDRVLDGGERGLLGLAFHPQYAANGRFFVNYTRETDGATVIAEYQRSANPNVALQAEAILLEIAQPFANHNGGMIAFGHDGFLYIGMGDGGSSNDPDSRAQDVNDLLGKMLRIDVDGAPPYAIPPDNPFAASTDGRDEIYATGLRNPFRFSFDRQTGLLFVGDVGQGQREEIDIVSLGDNLGWRVFEGTRCTELDPLCTSGGFTPPAAEYSHSGGRCSVTGGYVYRGSRGALASGTYVFGDFCTGEIFTLTGASVALLLDTTLNISSFGEDEAGELYVVGLGGTVHRLVADRANQRFGTLLRPLPDFDGQGAADVLWRHATPGAFAMWLMNGGAIGSSSAFRVATGWDVVGLGDLNGDGRSDILWRSTTSGALAIWLMNGGTVLGTAVVGVGPGWDLVASGDVNGDGRADILWRSVATGALGVWFMNGSTVVGTAVFGGVGPEWRLVGIDDVDGDGKADCLWRNAAGIFVIWFMNGGAVQSTAVFGVGVEWEVVGHGDVNADGTADILWRQPATGLLAVWFMNGGSLQSSAVFGSVGTEWSLVGVGDLNADGTADFLWREPTTGLLVVWFMNGGSLQNSSVFGVGTEWAPIGAV